MEEKEIINMLIKQNNRLMQILEKFADKDINVVVNSYNGASTDAINYDLDKGIKTADKVEINHYV